ncbi:hypothetical protein BYT27DRAFT_7163924 [Phlegmacium glaucopus]|nr:hypothetical protein BYT27DRAFT_7163924 [Phlegmacium glaucopus]
MSASHLPKTKPAPNFFSTYSVIVPVNLQTAYKVFGTAEGHDRVCHLSKLCANLELLEKDEITLPVPDYPEGRRLGDVGVRTASATTANTGDSKTLTRQHFVLEETVSMIFGLFKKKIKIVGTLTWDDSVLSPSTAPSASSSKDNSPVEALYESLSESGGVLVWKLRTFETVDGEPDKTRVTERIEGWAPTLLRPIVQGVTTVEHHAHMEQYHTLF